MKCSAVLAFVLVLASVSAEAASNVSSKYDGVYDGAATPAPDMGAANCSAFVLRDVKLEKGAFKPGTTEGGASLSVGGFITEEGYVSAYMMRPGHLRAPLDGRLDAGVIVAGFIEPDSGCIGVVHLRARP